MTFLLSEDKALRNLLTGMTVTDQKSDATGTATRSVKAYFGQPDQELHDQTYPYITIDMIDISEDPMRAMRGKAKPSYYTDPAVMAGTDGGTAYNSDLHDWEID